MKPRFFIDRGLGYGVVPNAIKEAGYDVFLHDDMFDQDTPDIEWLKIVGEKGLIVLSKDVNISRNPSEAMAIFHARVFAFLLASGSSTGPQNAEAFVKALPDIVNLIARNQPPEIFRVTLQGKVSKILGYEKIIDVGHMAPHQKVILGN